MIHLGGPHEGSVHRIEAIGKERVGMARQRLRESQSSRLAFSCNDLTSQRQRLGGRRHACQAADRPIHTLFLLPLPLPLLLLLLFRHPIILSFLTFHSPFFSALHLKSSFVLSLVPISIPIHSWLHVLISTSTFTFTVLQRTRTIRGERPSIPSIHTPHNPSVSMSVSSRSID